MIYSFAPVAPVLVFEPDQIFLLLISAPAIRLMHAFLVQIPTILHLNPEQLWYIDGGA
jgi:hypothetical protein